MRSIPLIVAVACLALAVPSHAEDPPPDDIVSVDYSHSENDNSVVVEANVPSSGQAQADAPAGGVNDAGGNVAVLPGPPAEERDSDVPWIPSCRAVYANGGETTILCVGNEPKWIKVDDGDSAAPVATVEQAAQSAVAKLTLPEPDIIIGPDPNKNKWKAIPVGFPIWLQNTNTETVTTTVAEQSITINITATPTKHEFAMGEGETVTCTTMATNPGKMTGTIPPESPDCGYRYEKPDHYTIESTTYWNVTWQANNKTGTMQVTTTNTKPIHINELRTVVIGP